MPRNYVNTIRLNRTEHEMIEEIAKELDVSKSEVWRRLFWTVRTIFSSYLPAQEALSDVELDEHEPSLADMLKPVPELMDVVLKEMERRKVFVRGNKKNR